MAPKKVTRGEKPKRKVVISAVEIKRNLSLNGEVVHVYQSWPLNMAWLVNSR
jgi:hypothetical protein